MTSCGGVPLTLAWWVPGAPVPPVELRATSDSSVPGPAINQPGMSTGGGGGLRAGGALGDVRAP